MICSEEFIEQVKQYKKYFCEYLLEGIDLNQVRGALKEIQEANQEK